MNTKAALRFLAVPAALLLALGVLAAACNGDDDDEIPVTPTPAPNDNGAAQEFDVTQGDNTFDPSQITVTAGEEVTFNINNLGVNAHNMRIAGEDNEFGTDDDAVSEPDILRSGDDGVLVWTAPQEPGDYDFRCDFHPVEMTGVITVQ